MEPKAPTLVNNASAHAALLGAWTTSYDSTATQNAYRADAGTTWPTSITPAWTY